MPRPTAHSTNEDEATLAKECRWCLDALEGALVSLDAILDKEDLVKIARTPMPFGKYQGRPLIDLPEAYLLWFAHQGFPKGNLGRWMALTLEIKTEGLEELVRPLKHTREPVGFKPR